VENLVKNCRSFPFHLLAHIRLYWNWLTRSAEIERHIAISKYGEKENDCMSGVLQNTGASTVQAETYQRADEKILSEEQRG
jgi:hypothetical protein